ncbi:hypothetical protein PsYK624_097230 [Phanerochaete sordida]|uniref:Uncharacterized protein n=1 Tax=Phanerochaete sordida TaxID=48140 RepID=A0A9P3LGE6_9APHY|nr:hypothetical protein PsYK624_097230 [Phanerochaete sordida]
MGNILSGLRHSESLVLRVVGYVISGVIWPFGCMYGGVIVFGGLAIAGLWYLVRTPLVLAWNAYALTSNALEKWRKSRKARKHANEATQTDEVALVPTINSEKHTAHQSEGRPEQRESHATEGSPSSSRPKLSVRTQGVCNTGLPPPSLGSRLLRRSS